MLAYWIDGVNGMPSKSTLIRAEGVARAAFVYVVVISLYVAVVRSGHDNELALPAALLACAYIPGHIIHSTGKRIKAEE